MSHRCRWPNCQTEVQIALWGCRSHWFMLPLFLRQKICAVYQFRDGDTDHPEYVAANRRVQQWIESHCQRHPEDICQPRKETP
jgi:hypothetical protein